MSDYVFLKGGGVVAVRRRGERPDRPRGRATGYKSVRIPFTWAGVEQAQAMVDAAEQRGDAEFVAIVTPQVRQMALRLQLAETRASLRVER